MARVVWIVRSAQFATGWILERANADMSHNHKWQHPPKTEDFSTDWVQSEISRGAGWRYLECGARFAWIWKISVEKRLQIRSNITADCKNHFLSHLLPYIPSNSFPTSKNPYEKLVKSRGFLVVLRRIDSGDYVYSIVSESCGSPEVDDIMSHFDFLDNFRASCELMSREGCCRWVVGHG